MNLDTAIAEPLELRPYQKQAIAALWTYWRSQPTSAPLLVLPTGAGKSVVIAKLVDVIRQAKPEFRLMVVSHVKEIIQQNTAEIRRFFPNIGHNDIGICSAGLGDKTLTKHVTMGTVQTLVNATAKSPPRVDVIFIDEAHLVPRRASSQYQKLLHNLQKTSPDLRVCGLTATPYRLDSGRLDQGDDALFNGVAFEVTLPDLIDRGHLVMPETVGKLEMGDLKKAAGEYTAASQSAALDRMIEDVIDDVVETTIGKRTLLFCPRIDTAATVAELLRKCDIAAEHVSSRNTPDERERLIGDFAAGRITHLTNVNLLTTGSNIPEIEAIALLRATTSPVLYTQMVGRGLRTHPGKESCLVRDYGGNAIRHGPLGYMPDNPETDETEPAKGKTCKACFSVIPNSAQTCPVCGADVVPLDIPSDKPNATKAYSGDLVGWKVRPDWWTVICVEAQPWKSKSSGMSTVRLSYECMLDGNPKLIREWLCPEHEGYARTKFERWWEKAVADPIRRPPNTVIGFLKAVHRGYLKRIRTIRVGRKADSKWDTVIGHEIGGKPSYGKGNYDVVGVADYELMDHDPSSDGYSTDLRDHRLENTPYSSREEVEQHAQHF